MAEVANLDEALKLDEQALDALQEQIIAFLSGIPNTPDSSVPIGKNENQNVEIMHWSTPTCFRAG